MQAQQELEVMKSIAGVLEPLDDDAKSRVIAWLRSAYGSDPTVETEGPQPELSETSLGTGFRDFPDLFDAANPQPETDRALVAAYWAQVIQNQADFDAQTANNMLKEMGHAASNITRALDVAQRATPALVRQIHKSGKTRQARKRYRLTTEGIRRVDDLITGPAEGMSEE